jgi:hypothetical protein
VGGVSYHGACENRPQKIRRIFVQTRRKAKNKRLPIQISLAPKFGSDPPWCAKQKTTPTRCGLLFRIVVLMRTVRKKSAGFLCRRGAKRSPTLVPLFYPAPKFGSDPPWCAKQSPMPSWRGDRFVSRHLREAYAKNYPVLQCRSALSQNTCDSRSVKRL